MKRETYVYIFGIVLVISLITPFLVYRAFISYEEIEESQDDKPAEEYSEEIISSISEWQNITNINLIKGKIISGNISNLTIKDNEYLSLKGNYSVGFDYVFEIEFEFPVDLNTLNIEFYDIYLYLDVGISTFSNPISFSAYQTFEWKKICDIGIDEIHINRQYLQRCTKFRLNGSSTADKTILIDRLQVFLTHSGILGDHSIYTLSDNHPYEYSYLSTASDIAGEYSGHYSDKIYTWQNNWWNHPNWYLYSSYQQAGYLGYFYDWITCQTEIQYEIHMEDVNAYNISDDSLFKMSGRVDIDFDGALIYPTWQFYIQIWNYNQSSWMDTIYPPYTNPPYRPNGVDWVAQWKQASLSRDITEYFNFDTHTWKVRVYTYARGYSDLGGEVEIENYYFGSFSDIKAYGYNMDDHDYPKINSIHTIPTSPINTTQQFDIVADVSTNNPSTSIDEVKCFISNDTWNSGWLDMGYDTANEWKLTLNAGDFVNDNYSVLVKSNDTNGLSTQLFEDFQTFNQRPQITFVKPAGDMEKITQLYNYNINASLLDPEEDILYETDVEIKIYPLGNEDNPIINWSNMQKFNPTNPEYYNFSINPIDFENGYYTIKIKANDSLGYGYGEIDIYIENNAPNITLVSPTETEITDTSILVQANITNEEPINSAQWDIVETLGSYDWKNLTYNPISELWETNISILDYEYGDYYLVFNATDDKHNSSLKAEFKQFHPFLTYTMVYEDISLNTNGLNVFINPAQTDDLTGSLIINHNPIAKERDWEVYLPNNFTDAYNYYLNRGFITYEPIGFDVEGIHTIWELPNYQISDIIRFSLEKPVLDNELIETTETEDGLEKLQFKFTLLSKHQLTNTIIHNRLEKYIPNPDDYKYTLEYLYGEEWVEITDYDLEIGATPSFFFIWDVITANGSITFRFTAEEQLVSQNPIGIWFLVGGLIGGVAVFFYGIYANYRELWSESKTKTILYGLLVFGIGFAGGIGIGYMLAPPTAFI
jgi:hypothetical protein